VPTPRRAAYLESLGEAVHGLRCVHARPAGVGHPVPASVPGSLQTAVAAVPVAAGVAAAAAAAASGPVPATLEAAG
jgi:hypothetical protein